MASEHGALWERALRDLLAACGEPAASFVPSETQLNSTKHNSTQLNPSGARPPRRFVPMALATNELNASFDEMELDVAPPRGRRSSVVDDAKEISRKVRESDVPPGFLPRVQM